MITRQVITGLRGLLHPSLSRPGSKAPARGDEWYIVLASALASAHKGSEALPLLYDMATQGRESDVNEGIKVQRRLKETVLKGSVLYGIPSTLESSFALMAHLRQAGRPTDEGFFLRRDQGIASVEERGRRRLMDVYRHNFDDIEAKFGRDMEDVKLITMPVNYGLILSEDSILDFASTELVILSALVPQNLRAETLWHLRGCRRAGWSDEVISSVRDVSMRVAELSGRPTDKVPDLDEVSETKNE